MKLFVLSALLSAALAFSNTAPVISWSSHSSTLLDSLPSKFTLDALLSSTDICGHDAVVFIDQPELRASDLRSLSPTSHLARSLASAPSSRQLPYVPNHGHNVPQLLETTAARCNSQYVSYAPGYGSSLSGSAKHLLALTFPPLDGLAKDRKEALLKHDDILSTELARIATLFPHHIVIYTSSASLSKRSTPVNLRAAPSPSSKGGILAHYQLLTPGLITALIITLFVLLPIIMLGINALGSIQSPLRVDPPKGFDAVEKKNQ
ncbi:hypothetical protein MIND_01383800 [Mycena indigotica]|uniref:Protein BIG1 n=1 Tax=Mycena indigotica TaxID=2126181 RepID=A0A8H6S0U6_9AGAR|nr:uncharacterized protein MIND_01383800 [Mycena indigotica]KAF7289225.1 hypothetical protein MIND_01383800 [Mycena indigotica]